MKLIIGLGNPGKKHKNNRHNVGHIFIDALKKRNLFRDIVCLKTNVYMNSSGEFIKEYLNKYKIKTNDLIVVHDDLDITLGNYKIQIGVGPKLHYGIASIEEELGTRDFWRVRIGVDNRDMENRISGEEYVLEDFTEEEEKKLTLVIKKAVKGIKKLMENG